MFRNFDAIAPVTAASRSASSKTMNGALPPSSSESFVTCVAHCAISFRPTAVEPVKLSARTTGLLVSVRPIVSASSPVTTLNTPAGSPACAPSSASASAVNGVASAGLTIIGQPAASAAPAFRVIIAAGKFQGVIAAVTPIGCRSTMMCCPRFGAGMTSP